MRCRCATPALLISGALLMGIALLAVGGALAEGAAYLLPATALAALLLLGGYPGERTLLALAGRSAPAGARGRRLRVSRPRVAELLLPRGGRLLGSPLAVRPPPRAS